MNKENSSNSIDTNLVFIGLTSFLTDTSTKLLYAILPGFLLSMGASKSTVGIIEGIAESTASILKAGSGVWSDRIGKKKPLMAAGYGLTALMIPVMGFVHSPFQALLVRFIERTGKGIRTAPRDSLIAASSHKTERARGFGLHKALDNTGAIVGPFLAYLMLGYLSLDYRMVFILGGLPAILGVVMLLVKVKEKRGEEEKSGTGQGTFREIPGRFYLFLGIMAIFTMGNSTDALLLIRSQETGIDREYIPLMYMIYNGASVLLAIPMGKISDRFGRVRMLVAGFIVYAAVYGMFGLFEKYWIYPVLFAIYGLYSAAAETSQKAMVSDLVGERNRGSGYGMYHGVVGIMALPSSILAGWLYDTAGSQAPFYFGAVMAVIASLLMIVFGILNRRGGEI